MSTPAETSSDRARWVVYAVAGGVDLVLIVIGLVANRGHASNQQSEAKAEQLIAAIDKAGYNPPSTEQVVGVLGDDGGATCADPSEALSQAVLRGVLSNGATGPGMRPTQADTARLLQGQLIAIQVYCPDELEDFKEYVDDLESEDVTES